MSAAAVEDSLVTAREWEGEPVAGRRCVLVGASKDPNRKISLLLLSERTGAPELVLKVALTPGGQAAIESEARALLDLAAADLGRIRGTIPRLIGRLEHQRRPALLMTAVPGTLMLAGYHRWRHTARPADVRLDFEAAGDWLAAFQAATASGRGPLEMGATLLDRLAWRYRDDAAADVALAAAESALGRLRQASTPRSACHGDLWAGNLLLEAAAVSGVVDWEQGEARGEPVRDLARFALTYALYLDRHTVPGRRIAGHGELRAGWGAGIVHAYRGDGWFAELVAGFIEKGLARLGARAAWRDVLLAGLADVAATADDPEFGRRHLALIGQIAAAAAGRE
jgi:Phosphotransferase enzyme family